MDGYQPDAPSVAVAHSQSGGRDRAQARAGWPAMTMLPEVCEPRRAIPRPDVLDAVALAAVLSDPIRAGILRMLRDGAYCVCELAETLGARENNVSNHLAKLRAAGLVRASRHRADARWIYYERDEAACRAALGEIQRVIG